MTSTLILMGSLLGAPGGDCGSCATGNCAAGICPGTSDPCPFDDRNKTLFGRLRKLIRPCAKRECLPELPKPAKPGLLSRLCPNRDGSCSAAGGCGSGGCGVGMGGCSSCGLPAIPGSVVPAPIVAPAAPIAPATPVAPPAGERKAVEAPAPAPARVNISIPSVPAAMPSGKPAF